MAPGAGKLSGELGLVGLYDLGQLLTLNRATGRLALEHEGRRAALFFREGRIVNAVDQDLREGEAAAYQVFVWKQGRFEFFPESVGNADSIEGSTESLMLEAARRQDETNQRSGGETGAEKRVRERQSAMESLRDVFHDVARDARRPGAASSDTLGVGGDSLSRAGDRLVLRPGRPPRLRVRGMWRDVRETAITPAEYEDFKVRMLGSAAARTASAAERSPRIAALPDGREVAVTLVSPGPDEALWLRPVHLPGPDPACLHAGSETLAQVLALPRVVLVVCADDGDDARQLLHAITAELHARAEECLLAAREMPVYRHPERSGILAECVPWELSAALLAVRPDTLVLDLDQPLAEHSLLGLDPVRRVIARVPGASAHAIAAGWRVRFDGVDRERFAAHSLGWPTYLARAVVSAKAGARPSFEVIQLGAGALSGNATPRPDSAAGDLPAAA